MPYPAEPSNAIPTHATNTNYSDVGQPWDGTPTKVAPSAAIQTQGFKPAAAIAGDYVNHILNTIASWLTFLYAYAKVNTSIVYSNWVQRDVASTVAAKYLDVAYKSSTDVWVLVGQSATIRSSTGTAAEVWTARTAGGGYTSDLLAIDFDGTNFIAVGSCFSASGIQTSPDGTTWTQRTAAASYTGTFNGVASGGGVVVAVGSSGEIQSSADNGVTWTHRTAAASYSGTFADVFWAGGLFVAVGSGPAIQTSPDGTTWTSRTVPGSVTDLAAIVFGNGTWLATVIGQAYTLTSPDGITWTKQTGATLTANGGNALAFTGRFFLAVNENDFAVHTSSDGITWARNTIPTAVTIGPIGLGVGDRMALAVGGPITDGSVFASLREG